jgi:hypothetical protein
MLPPVPVPILPSLVFGLERHETINRAAVTRRDHERAPNGNLIQLDARDSRHPLPMNNRGHPFGMRIQAWVCSAIGDKAG